MLTEQVSEERFKDFKDEMIRAVSDLKGAIDTLSNKIDAFTCVSQQQSQDIAVLKIKAEEVDKLKDKVEDQGKEIVAIKTDHKTSQRNLTIIFTAITILIGVISLCIAIFK